MWGKLAEVGIKVVAAAGTWALAYMFIKSASAEGTRKVLNDEERESLEKVKANFEKYKLEELKRLNNAKWQLDAERLNVASFSKKEEKK